MKVERERKRKDIKEQYDGVGDGDEAESQQGKKCEVKTVDVHTEMLTAKNRISVCAVKGLQSLESI